jgi:hypothetical protein
MPRLSAVGISGIHAGEDVKKVPPRSAALDYCRKHQQAMDDHRRYPARIGWLLNSSAMPSQQLCFLPALGR